MQLDPRRLLVLRSVVSGGGVGQAATALHLTPSAVSQQLAALEREVGVPLLDRSRRRLGLTRAGELLVRRAGELAEVLAAARHDLASVTGRVTGPITVAAFMSAVPHLVVPAMDALARTHPAVRLTIAEVEGEPAFAALRSGRFDLVLAEYDEPSGWSPPAGSTATALLADEYRVVVPSAWCVSVRAVSDLADRPWVAGPATGACGKALRRLEQASGLRLAKVHECLEFPTVLAVVAGGLGAAVVPTLALAAGPPDGVTVTPLRGLGGRSLVVLRRSSPAEPEPVVAAATEALAAAARAVVAAVA